MNDQKAKLPPYFWAAAIVFFGTWAAILASAFGVSVFPKSLNFERTGQFGDSFGFLNAIMASFAAISAFAAFQSQREELDRTKKAEENRDLFAYKRDFESTFFNLLTLLRETVKEIDADIENVKYKTDLPRKFAYGRDAITKILERLEKQKIAEDRDKYIKIYGEYRDDLGHYFRTFYHIVRFIDESEIEDKKRYIRLLRATLSNAEIVLIGLNCIHGGGNKKLKPLVERYALLHNISSQYAERWGLTTSFHATAFGDRVVSSEGKLGS